MPAHGSNACRASLGVVLHATFASTTRPAGVRLELHADQLIWHLHGNFVGLQFEQQTVVCFAKFHIVKVGPLEVSQIRRYHGVHVEVEMHPIQISEKPGLEVFTPVAAPCAVFPHRQVRPNEPWKLQATVSNSSPDAL